MPLLYGKGATKALRRTQYDIISPRASGNHVDMVPQQSRYLTRGSNRSVPVSNRGVSLDLYVTPFPKDKSHTIFLAFLDCDMRLANSTSSLAPVIILQRTAWDNDSDMVRIRPDLLELSMMNNAVLPDEVAVMLLTGSASQESTISQPGLRRIFVPRDFKRTRPPGGVVFYPEIKQTASKLGLRVRARSPTWHEERHRIAGNDLERVLVREKREEVLQMHDNVIASSLGSETRYSKLMYNVKSEVEDQNDDHLLV
ncbi:hypothetical protein C2857_001890 [Epichloe festucae Fl1]|uniref:Uncharacterized protein n=1 Tax=Epichloe festucae (strain Fl1) TaxID=877507 RepID=A0A7S9PVF1_EPIFF|nr:hypothetical protein C2857_001890 [Epichloe festucae Fl1]